MRIFGLHWLDFSIIVAYLVGMLALGSWASRRTKTEGDFYMAGRQARQVLPVFPELRLLDQRRPGRRRLARDLPPGHRRDVDPVSRPLPDAVLLVHDGLHAPVAADHARGFFHRAFRSRFLGAAFAVFTLVMAFIGGGVELHGRGQDGPGPDARSRSKRTRPPNAGAWRCSRNTRSLKKNSTPA